MHSHSTVEKMVAKILSAEITPLFTPAQRRFGPSGMQCHLR
jgi:hypothetical protein